MTKGSLGLRGSNGSLPSMGKFPLIVRRPSSKALQTSYREKDKVLPFICRYLGRKKIAMLLLICLALYVFIGGSFTVAKEMSASSPVKGPNQTSSPIRNVTERYSNVVSRSPPPPFLPPSHQVKHTADNPHPCHNFAKPPSPPDPRRKGPRPCPVCYLAPEKAKSSMPSFPSESPVLRNLTYVIDKYPAKSEPHGGSDFGGYPSLKQRNDSFDIKESMAVHCGFVKGRPGRHTGFDIDEADLTELEQSHDAVVASAIFGNYDLIQQPKNISEAARKNIPFYMFIDKETEVYMRNHGVLNDSMRVGIWKVIVVHNVPYSDARRNGKIPKLLLHRMLPNVRYSIWIDGKLQLVVDPYQLLERFLWRDNANFAISRHYRRFDVFEEAEANKAAGKYSNASIDYQIEFYKKEGLTPYTRAKLPITSDVPEGCVIIREHVPITNLFTCLWFNEVDRFTSRDQLSFSTVRDKIMTKVDWSVKMFLDCERRNFVIQAYHRELLERMPPPAPPVIRRPPPRSQLPARKNPGKGSRRGRRSGSKRNRKIAAGTGDKQVL